MPQSSPVSLSLPGRSGLGAPGAALAALALLLSWSPTPAVAAPDAVAAPGAVAASPAAPQAPAGEPRAAGELAVERLAGLARLWGKVKVFHPYLAYKDLDWDQALVETIPLVEAATTPEEYRGAIEHLLAALGDPATRVLAPDEATGAEELLGDDEAPREGVEAAPPTVRWLDGDLAWIDARDYDALAATDQWQGGLFTAAFTEAREAAGAILDLRRLPGGSSYLTHYFLDQVLRTDLPSLLAEDLVLPSVRRRVHSGYAPQAGGASGYYSGFITEDHRVLAAAGGVERQVPLVVLTNARTVPVLDLLAGLQGAGLAVVVHVGEAEDLRFSGAGGVVDLPEGLKVRLRTEEMVHADGSVGFVPRRILAPAEEGTAGAEEGEEDAALAEARRILQGEATAEDSPPLPADGAPAVNHLLQEAPYEEMTAPSREVRLLALFRFWNVIEYFFPYKHLTDQPWEEVLTELIPRFQDAEGEEAYALAVAELVAHIQDSHGFLSSPAFSRYVGTHNPPLRVRFLGGDLVVTHVLDPELEAATTVLPGDVVVAVNGETVEARRERLGRYLAASTPQALDWRLRFIILAGQEGEPHRLAIRRGEEAPREVVLEPKKLDWPAVQARLEAEKLPVYTRLPQGYGYLDLTRLERHQVPEAFEALRDAPALIFDMRGYPKGTAWTITPYLAAEPATAARFRRPLHVDVSEKAASDFTFEQPFPAGGPWQVQVPIAVLIDERAISQAEHSCLFFEAAYDDVTFIGTPTNGANGDVTSVVLPGGITVSFSGHDVRHADGRQLQRVGIQPDLRIEPTAEGIRAGRDEVLEAALEYLAGRVGSGEGGEP